MNELEKKPYSSFQVAMHWLVALLVFSMLGMGFFLEDLPSNIIGTGYMMHKSTGLLILGLMVVRFISIQTRGRPGLPEHMSLPEIILVRTIQYGFYVLLIAMPLSGWIMSSAANHPPSFYGLITLPFPGISPDTALTEYMGEWHERIAWTLIVFIVLHVSGTIKHYFWDKDGIWERMSPFK